MRLVQATVRAGERDEPRPEVPGRGVLLDPVPQVIGFPDVDPGIVAVAGTNQYVHTRPCQLLPLKRLAELRPARHHRAAGPVRLVHDADALRLAVREEDPNGGRHRHCGAHAGASSAAGASGSTSRVRPVRSSCIMPCLS